MCQLHNTLFCLSFAHHSLLLLPFAWLQATKLFVSTQTLLAVEFLPWQPHSKLVWIPVWWMVYGSLSLYFHLEWSICIEIATELCMAECHDLDDRGWRMQVMKHFVRLFQRILLNEWTGNRTAVSECMTIGQKRNSECLIFGFFVFNSFKYRRLHFCGIWCCITG